ncbi:hypothetical protein GCM10029976_047430 [Kribbella albertanoniae]|uniref:Glycosyl hydrolase family protein n=1 Tax=Kribbella albertanoniae TaxID=1266829 RepID=A0A4R4QEX6_9ACTN|nr:chondroitinase-B domain-containing protein [Kribbella albertanoniae]TDC34156.1 hypothetical protein E1261_04335 [Kribbella albertanoniae]
MRRVRRTLAAVVVAVFAVSNVLSPAAADPLPVVSATASADDGNVAANTLDGDLTTRWSAQGDGVWIRYDLGSAQTVGSVSIAWHQGNSRKQTFDVELSADGSTWSPALTRKVSSGSTTQLEKYDIPDASARYVRVVGHGNTYNNWNSITETTIAGADGPGGECRYPADVLDLQNWYVGLPIGEEESPKNVYQPELATYSIDPWFVPKADCSGVQFRAAVNGVTTSGSSYPRSELREMNGSAKASWSSTSGTHTMVIDQAITAAPQGRPNVVAGQIHDASDDVSVFRLEGSRLYVTNGNTSQYKLVDGNYVLGTRFQAKFVVSDGQIKAYYNGVLQTTIAKTFSGGYFKAGAYTQANCGNASPCSASNYGQVEIYDLSVTHSNGNPAETTAAERFGWGTPLPGSDEFNYGSVGAPAVPDQTKWSLAGGGVDQCWPGHNENGRRCDANTRVVGGVLRMLGEADGDSGWLASKNGRQYGRWEARVRSVNTGTANGREYHPLLIIWPDSNSRLADGEYDYLENGAPGEACAEAFMHYPHDPGPVQQEHASETNCGTPLSEWHNVAFEWTATHVAGFIDGREWFRFSDGASSTRECMQCMTSGHQTIQLDNFYGTDMTAATYELDWYREYAAPAAQETRLVPVSTSAQLSSAFAAAQPGDAIELADGSYTIGKLTRCAGTAEKPIVVRAAHRGGATIAAGQLELSGCSYVTVEGLRWRTDQTLKITSSHHVRLTRNDFQLTEDESLKWVLIGGTGSHHNRIDHNDFHDKRQTGNYVTIDGSATQQSQYDVIDHNHFRDIGPRAANEMESIRVGWSEISQSSGFTTIEHNLFENCDGDPEIVSVKSNDNVVRHNTFRTSAGVLSARHGNRNSFHGNFFLGGGKAGTGGIRVYGQDHKIFNNYFADLRGTGYDAALSLDGGDVDTSGALNKHWRVYRALVANNTFVSNASTIEIGRNYSLPPVDSTIVNNIVTGTAGPLIQEFKPPVRLTYTGNIAHPTGSATVGIDKPATAIRVADPQLALDGTLYRPAPGSPAADTAVGSTITDDMDGQPRDAVPDVGADELSTAPILQTPATAANVGPNAP